MPGVLRFPSEVAILRKEVFNNWYKLRTYYLATVITSIPIHVSQLIRFYNLCGLINDFFFVLTDIFCGYLCNNRIFHYWTTTGTRKIFKSHADLYTSNYRGWQLWNTIRHFSQPSRKFLLMRIIMMKKSKAFVFRTERFSLRSLHASCSCSPDFLFSLNTCQRSW